MNCETTMDNVEVLEAVESLNVIFKCGRPDEISDAEKSKSLVLYLLSAYYKNWREYGLVCDEGEHHIFVHDSICDMRIILTTETDKLVVTLRCLDHTCKPVLREYNAELNVYVYSTVRMIVERVKALETEMFVDWRIMKVDPR